MPCQVAAGKQIFVAAATLYGLQIPVLACKSSCSHWRWRRYATFSPLKITAVSWVGEPVTLWTVGDKHHPSLTTLCAGFIHLLAITLSFSLPLHRPQSSSVLFFLCLSPSSGGLSFLLLPALALVRPLRLCLFLLLPLALLNPLRFFLFLLLLRLALLSPLRLCLFLLLLLLTILSLLRLCLSLLFQLRPTALLGLNWLGRCRILCF
mmetsp:Transcript_32368/g.63720  ORF Transcript_32368/g.63720 Transcript_32368/m.63720 type:complete len:207 (-) Transcript_32368:504-1124(-)